MTRRGRLRLVGGSRGDDSKSSFERHYRESYALVYNYVYRRMPNREATEDVVSDAYLRAARFYDRFDDSRAKFSTWVISIAHNCMNDFYNREIPTTPIELVPQTAYADSVEEDALSDSDQVRRLLAILDDQEYQLVFLKYYEGLRNVELAEQLGMNPSTVSTKLARAMAKMRTAAENAERSIANPERTGARFDA